jgi:hypothetical protein
MGIGQARPWLVPYFCSSTNLSIGGRKKFDLIEPFVFEFRLEIVCFASLNTPHFHHIFVVSLLIIRYTYGSNKNKIASCHGYSFFFFFLFSFFLFLFKGYTTYFSICPLYKLIQTISYVIICHHSSKTPTMPRCTFTESCAVVGGQWVRASQQSI